MRHDMRRHVTSAHNRLSTSDETAAWSVGGVVAEAVITGAWSVGGVLAVAVWGVGGVVAVARRGGSGGGSYGGGEYAWRWGQMGTWPGIGAGARVWEVRVRGWAGGGGAWHHPV